MGGSGDGSDLDVDSEKSTGSLNFTNGSKLQNPGVYPKNGPFWDLFWRGPDPSGWVLKDGINGRPIPSIMYTNGRVPIIHGLHWIPSSRRVIRPPKGSKKGVQKGVQKGSQKGSSPRSRPHGIWDRGRNPPPLPINISGPSIDSGYLGIWGYTRKWTILGTYFGGSEHPPDGS